MPVETILLRAVSAAARRVWLRSMRLPVRSLLMPQIERLEAQTDPVRGMLIYFKGAVVNKSGKTENKDYKLFAPTAVIVPMRNKVGNQVQVAVCKGCESWTTEVVKFINLVKTSGPVKTN